MTQYRTPERTAAVLIRMPASMRKELKQCALDRDTSMNELLRQAAAELLKKESPALGGA
jgi:hypothetical protein